MVNNKFSFKKNIIIIIIAVLFALGVGGTAVALGISNAPANRVSRYIGAAERYLSEQNYEQALIEFQRVLEIEPMNVDAYLGLADAYIGMGEPGKATDVLISGSGKPGYVEDPLLMLPDNFKNYSDNIEDHVNFKFDSLETELDSVTINDSKLYLLFMLRLNYSYDILNSQWTNHGAASNYVLVSVNASVENDTVKIERYDEAYHGFEGHTWSGGYLCYESNDSRILRVRSATAHSEFILDSGNVRKAMITFDFGSNGTGFNGNHYKYDDLNFYSINSFINDQLMICQKPISADSKDNVYAVFWIKWEDFESVDSSFDMHLDKEYNDKHKRLTDFYDNISWNDEMLEMGYLLVCQEDKWGYVSVETSKELAMYDDASNFSNGYAVVTNNGKGCIIDSEFNVVSDEFPCTSASTLGDGVFVVRTDDKILRLELGK